MFRTLALAATLTLLALTSQAQETPTTTPARFLAFDAMGQNPAEAMTLARSFLAPTIAEAEAAVGQPITVMPVLVTFADGRRMLQVALCDATYFGITGCASYYYLSAPGDAGFIQALELIGAGDVWFDAQLGVAGWPDLIFGKIRLEHPDFTRWRWNGVTYDVIGPM